MQRLFEDSLETFSGGTNASDMQEVWKDGAMLGARELILLDKVPRRDKSRAQLILKEIE